MIKQIFTVPDENALNIYTDGSSYSNPRRGGIGVRFVFPESLNMIEVVKDFSLVGYKNATNNQMELMACIKALEEVIKLENLNKIRRIIIHTDSSYVVDNYKKAIYEWSRNKWLKRNGDPVINADLWKKLSKNIKETKCIVDFEWVKGHKNNEDNKAVDKLAKKSAKKPFKKLNGVVNVRRKISKRSIETGNVKMRGQKIKIRIITAEYLKIQKLYKCKYEVVSKSSNYFGFVDLVFSKENLRAGHTYLVSFIKKGNNHQISKIFSDLTKEKRGLENLQKIE